MTSGTVTVVNRLGMHARAAAKFVHVATRFQSHISVAHDTRQMDGKSIMGILLLAAACGSILTITANGSDEADAVEALTALVQSGFGEDAGTGSGVEDETPGPSSSGQGSEGHDL
jgi:phosphocarrier protein